MIAFEENAWRFKTTRRRAMVIKIVTNGERDFVIFKFCDTAGIGSVRKVLARTFLRDFERVYFRGQRSVQWDIT